MPSANAVRSQIEAALAARIPAALTPAARVVGEVMPTGVAAVDEVLRGGLPVGALTEMVGAEGSGRTGLALRLVAQATRAGKVCAWVDASDALSPESAAACGVELARLLWVRCGVARGGREAERCGGGFELPQKYFVAKPAMKGLHGGGMGGHPRGEAKGMDAAVSGLLHPPDIAEPQRRVRDADSSPWAGRAAGGGSYSRGLKAAAAAGRQRPWGRMEQALQVTDLLLQAGGFAAIVLDMGSLAAEHVSRIPPATWFRYRAGAERTRASVVLLTQYGCAKSSAGLVLRMEGGDPVAQAGTVLCGFERRVEVSRQRFEQSEEKVVTMGKPPQRAGVAAWRSQAAWAGRAQGGRG